MMNGPLIARIDTLASDLADSYLKTLANTPQARLAGNN
jgi:hypothetical protein